MLIAAIDKSKFTKTLSRLKTACLICLCVCLCGSATVAAQEDSAAAAQDTTSEEGSAAAQDDDQTDARLTAIEAAIQQLTEQIQQLRAAQVPPSSIRTPQSTASDDTSASIPEPTELPEGWLADMPWRELGPANMAGRITDLEVHSLDPSLWFIGTASGGLLKTTNQGTTVDHQFDHEETISIGAIATDPQNTEVIWVGTGESNPRNSVSYGNGVYKSEDGGATWTHKGLDETFQIARVIVHPQESDTVYVGASGRLYGTNPERGVYKTTDGGETWEKVLFIDDRTGVIDLIMSPTDSNTLIAACWDRLRDGFDAWPGDVPKPDGIDGYDPVRKWGPGAGLYKTTDGGANWTKLETGLPPGMIGRVGLDWQTKPPYSIFAIIDCEDIGKGPAPFSAYLGIVGVNREGQAVVTQVIPDSPAANAEVARDDVLVQIDGQTVNAFDDLLEALRAKSPGESLSLQLQRNGETVDVEIELASRPGSRQSNTAVMGINGEDVEGGGAKLTSVSEGGPSAQAGLNAGDVVKKVNGEATENYQSLLGEIRSRQPGDQMTVTVQRGQNELEFTVTLGSRDSGAPSTRPYTYSYFGQRPNVQDQQGADGYRYGGIYKSVDSGDSWERVNSLNVRPMYFSEIRVDPSDDQLVYVLGVSQFRSTNGGATFSTFGRGVHADCHDLWINPDNGRHMIIGSDGGFYVTHDRGANWDHINTAAIGQFYDVTISNHQPYWVFGGLQDNGSWGGPGISLQRGALIQDWISVGGGDGFVCRTDPEDPDIVYSESQNGFMGRRNLRTGERASIRPRPEEGYSYRFNWKTPFILSNHNPKIFYTAGNYVFRSLNRGDDLQRISPEITLTQRGSATAVAESPLNPNVLYVGSDDGALWVTRDGGVEWTNITRNLRAPGPRWVSTIDTSRFAEGRVYVCLDGHRSDDDDPHVYVSDDFGMTFRSIRANLPWGSTRTLREDPLSENLLYVGTEFGFFVSIDRGESWAQFNQELPTVAIHEVATHAELPEIVLATHGRSLWACDVSALRQLSAESLAQGDFLLEPSDVTRWRSRPSRGRTNRRFVGSNPYGGARIWYHLAEDHESVSIQISNIQGQVIRELNGQSNQGLHQVNWDLAATGGQRGRTAANGTYRVSLVVDGEALEDAQTVTIQADPTLSSDALSEEEYEAQLLQFESDQPDEDEDRDFED